MAGRLVHFEIRAGDWDRAKRFYGSLLGWKFSESSGPIQYSLVDAGGDPAGAIYPSESSERGVVVYFDVDSIERALTQVTTLGGTVLADRQAIPGVGWTARCRDPEGNEFSLFQSDTSAPPGG